MADLYPQVRIGGSVGLSGPLETLGSGTALGISLGPILSWSFPNRPVVRARIAQADARVQGSIASFDAVVLEALRQAGIKVAPDWVVRGGFKEADGYRGTQK